MAKKKTAEIMTQPVALAPEVEKEFKKHCSAIKRELDKAENSFLKIGFSIHWIYQNKSFESRGHKNIYDFAKAEFGIARGTCNNFINVVDYFGKKDKNGLVVELEDKYKSFKSSQLIAMLGCIKSGDELDCFTADMSVREIKKLVKDKEGSDDNGSDVQQSGKQMGIDDIIDADSMEVRRNVLITCLNKDDYESKIDEIDKLITNAFNKSKDSIRIEIAYTW